MWKKMMYCCSLWDSDNTDAKAEKGKGRNPSLQIQFGLETGPLESEHLRWTNLFPDSEFSPVFFSLLKVQLPNWHFNLNVNYIQGLNYFH